MTSLNAVLAVPLLVLLALTTHSDLRDRRIPNVLSLGGAVIGVIVQAALFGPIGIVYGLIGWALCLICFLPFYVLGGMSAGDVKLMAAVGAFVGPVYGIAACVCTLIAGSILGVAYLALRAAAFYAERRESFNDAGQPAPTYVRAMSALGSGLRSRFPYAAAIAVGTVVVLLQPALLTAIIEKGGWA